ncbi:MAG: magnesium transporter, partial [Candidatus Alkaliphilus sp. MAG34]
LVTAFTDQEVSDIIEELYTDDAVDFLEELPANAVNRVLSLATPDTRKLLNHYMKFEEDTAGSIMTSEYVMLHPSYTVAEAIRYIRTHGADRETIYTCYISDPTRRLIGVVSVRQLLLADDEQMISEVMEENVISVEVDTDQEEVTNIFTDYDLIALPVVDKENRLVGIITIDDIVDVIDKVATRDFQRMAAMGPAEEEYLRTDVFTLAKQRTPWLLTLMLSATFTGGIISRYESVLEAIVTLNIFIPMLMDSAGNAGTQSSTLIIRGLALGNIQISDYLKVLWKELRVSSLVGFILATVNFFRVIIIEKVSINIALTVSVTLFFTVILAKVVGGLLPVIAKKLKTDPAIMAGPLITTIVDALALIVYFNIAHLMLGI